MIFFRLVVFFPSYLKQIHLSDHTQSQIYSIVTIRAVGFETFLIWIEMLNDKNEATGLCNEISGILPVKVTHCWGDELKEHTEEIFSRFCGNFKERNLTHTFY